ncbi:MAG: hypothetical protein A2Z97_10015 [Bdellovibrionales bacterium GWB1_52_6]|nr:MAG: hypothetical protein A2Z97_10015 [Bdellovibrionales bacterium GWB1_52_6]
MENGEIQDMVIERPSGKGVAGNIYKGRVTRVLPGMQAAFVDIGLEKAAFLYVDDVFVHSEIWEEEEGTQDLLETAEGSEGTITPNTESGAEGVVQVAAVIAGSVQDEPSGSVSAEPEQAPDSVTDADRDRQEKEDAENLAQDFLNDADDEEDDEDPEDEDDHGPIGMEQDPEDKSGTPEGTVAPEREASAPEQSPESRESQESQESKEAKDVSPAGEGQDSAEGEGGDRASRRGRRGRRGGRYRRKERSPNAAAAPGTEAASTDYPENYVEQVAETGGDLGSDRSSMMSEGETAGIPADRPTEAQPQAQATSPVQPVDSKGGRRPEFRETRSRDRRIKPKVQRSVRGQVNIQDLLKEGQEVLVQVAKEPIATKGARLTCHISLPGRHLVCMPTIDHVGVSRRIERDDERRKLREHVERYRPKNLGFIVRTASGRQQSEKRIKQDIDYLARLWTEIREKAAEVTAPAMVYEDLNPVLRAIRDWVTEDIDKIVVDSRYHFNEIQRFVAHFMPSLRQKIDLYHGDVPVFDAYGISTELARALERKVWLKSGGYLVIDQAEALVAIDVNTGRFVGKKNLEDTILKTNLEAVEEIAYQLRLRNAGGIIILDLIDMEKEENKHRVYRALEEALKKDRARPTIMKISDLGLVEMTRKRTRDTMVRTLCESCTVCEGKGYIKSKQTVAYEVLRELEREGIEKDIGKILVQAHPDVIDTLAIDERETLDHMERRYRKQIYLQAAAEFHIEQFEVVGDKGPRSEKSREQGSDHRSDHREQRDRGRGGRDRGGRDREQQRQPKARVIIQPVIAGQPEKPEKPVTRGVITPLAHPLPLPVRPSEVEHAREAGPGPEGETSPGNMVIQPRMEPDHDMTEEDRLAFLRAQAAQDAALAKYHGAAGGPNAAAPGRGAGGKPGDRNRDRDQDRDRNARKRRGRRGGRFRRDNRKDFGGPQGPGQEGSGVISPKDSGNHGGHGGSGDSGAGGNSGGDTGGGAGGGGEHSQPPV